MNLAPQLAESIRKEDLPKYLSDDRYVFGQKLDGFRKLARITPGRVEMLNRKGEPEVQSTGHEVYKELMALAKTDLYLDGEYVDGVFWIFDLPSGGKVTPSSPYEFRREVLDLLAPSLEGEHVKVLPVARTPEEKMALSRAVISAGGEGFMLNDNQARYCSGQRHNGLLKCKLVKDVDAIITRFNVGTRPDGTPKQNCELAVFNDEGHLQVIGECIIHEVVRNQVEAGSVVTVAYLYAVDVAKPRLVQPTRLRPRDDKDPDECLLSQIRITDKGVLTEWTE